DKSEKSTGIPIAGGLTPDGDEAVFGPIRSLKSNTSGISGALATGAAGGRAGGIRFGTLGVARGAEGAGAPAMSGKPFVGMTGPPERAATRGGIGGTGARSMEGGGAGRGDGAKSAGGIVAGGTGGARGRDAGRAMFGLGDKRSLSPPPSFDGGEPMGGGAE